MYNWKSRQKTGYMGHKSHIGILELSLSENIYLTIEQT